MTLHPTTEVRAQPRRRVDPKTGPRSARKAAPAAEAPPARPGGDALLDEVFRSASIGLIVIDEAGRIVRVNPYWLGIYGYREEEIIGCDVALTVAEDQREAARAKLVRQFSDDFDPSPYERELTTKGGERRCIRITSGRFTDKNGSRFLINTVRDITETRRREAAFARQSLLLRMSLDNMKHGLCVFDAKLQLVLWNDLYFDLMGYPREFARAGMPYEAFIRHNAVTGEYGPGDPDDLVATRLKPEHLSRSSITEWRRKSGRILEFRRDPLPGGGLIATMTDITEQRRAQAALRDSEAMKSATIASAIDGIVIADEMGRIIEFNPAAEQIFGYRREQVIGRLIEEVAIPPARRAHHAEGMKRLRSNQDRSVIGRRIEVEAMRADGSLFPAELSVTEVALADRKIFTAYLRDLTERKEAEAEIARQREALHQSEKMSALGSLLAGIAHELNNPLTVVVGQAMMMEHSATDPTIRARAEKIGQAADRCARIVRSFLAMARQRPARRGQVRLNAIVEAALELMDYPLRTSDIETTLDLAPDLPPLWGDGDQLAQVLANLIVNAQQALSESASPRRLAITTRFDPVLRVVRLEVADNGPGIAKEVQGRVFEPFFTTKPAGVGTGIGLSVCHGVIAAHGGTIAVESAPGRGSRFIVQMPLAPPRTAEAGAEAEAAAKVAPRAVLVVDDEPEIASMLVEILTGDGHQAEIAPSGRVALQRLAERRYDLIISDLRMPDMDGPSLYRSLRDERPDLAERMIFITGDTLGATLSGFLGESGRPYIEKPFVPADIRRVIARALAGVGGNGAAAVYQQQA